MVEANTMIEKDLYKSTMGEKGIYLTPYKWSATERRLLLVKSEKYKPFRAFELNYSKWATYNIHKFEDITILKTFDKKDYFYQKGDYLVRLSGKSNLESAEDTFYENWCGNLEVRKQFKNCMEEDRYFELEIFLEETEGLEIIEIESDVQFIIPRKDYLKLKKIFNESKF